jgi:hypothetical protein
MWPMPSGPSQSTGRCSFLVSLCRHLRPGRPSGFLAVGQGVYLVAPPGGLLDYTDREREDGLVRWNGSLVVALAWMGMGSLLAAPVATHWPRKELIGGGILVRYEPEIEAWHGYAMLQARQALSFRSKNSRRRVYGAIRFMAMTVVDHASRMVSIQNPRILEGRFPTLEKEQAAQAIAWLEENFPQEPIAASLDALLERMADHQATRDEIAENNQAPQIFWSQRPASLVLLDGPPVLQGIPGTELDLVVNTDSLLVKSRRHEDFYLLLGTHWYRADSLKGSWEAVRRLPQSFRRIPRSGFWAQLRNQVPAPPVADGPPPEIYVCLKEAELIETRGTPRFREISGTSLSYLENSPGDVFLDRRSGQRYTLLSGRWFQGGPGEASLQPLQGSLPEDLAKIPPGHVRHRVVLSVPGTPEAQEAAIAAQVPRFKQVKRGAESFQASYLGPPRFVPIGRTGVEVAENTSYDIFRVKGRYLALERGVWFESSDSQGPWNLAERIPREIYSIPPTHPSHHVTFARVYGADENSLLAGYLPGYLGTMVSGGKVVHGVGKNISHSPDFYRHVFQRRQDWWKDGALRADRSTRPFHLDPFYRRSYGYGFRYNPRRALFLPSTSRTPRDASAELPPPPVVPQAPTPTPEPSRTPKPHSPIFLKALRAALEVGSASLKAGPDGTLYRFSRRGWESLGPKGWGASEGPPRTSTGVPGGSLGTLPPYQAGEGGGKASVWPPPRSGKAGRGKGKKLVAVGKVRGPKLAEGYDKYRWTRRSGGTAPVYTGNRGYYGYSGGYGYNPYAYYGGPVVRFSGGGGVAPRPSPSTRTGAIGPVNTNLPSTFRSPTAGRPSLQAPTFGRPTLQRRIPTVPLLQ